MYKTHPPPLNIFSPLIYILYSNASIARTMFTLSFVTTILEIRHEVIKDIYHFHYFHNIIVL